MLIFFSWGLGGLPDTDFGEIANLRWNKSIPDFDKIKSKEEYIRKLEDYLGSSESGRKLITAKKRSWDSISNDAFENSSAVDVVEGNVGSLSAGEAEVVGLRARALRFEASRKRVSRLRDEARTARDTRAITERNFRVWRSRPNRLDLRRVDTARRRPRSVKGVNSRRLSGRLVLSSGDRRLTNFRVFIDVKRRVKVYRTLDGRFSSNPFVRRRRS